MTRRDSPFRAFLIWFRWRLRNFVRWWRNWWNRHVEIDVVPYVGYASETRAFVIGRVLKDMSISPGTLQDSRWRNLINSYKRFMSHEIPNAQVKVTLNSITKVLTTDDEGYFQASFDLPEPLEGGWAEAQYEMLAPILPQHKPDCKYGKILTPGPNTTFGVISDIDDTIVQTDATRWFKVLYTILMGNAATRLPFKGVSAFYDALQRGRTSRDQNPLFYVSSSPWNLFDALQQFLELQNIPLGPLLLRDWGGSSSLIPLEHGSHKNQAIHQILETYPKLPFILIGDSGQEDPEIYRNVVHDFPERILAVYIRNVSNELRAGTIAALAREVEQAGSTLVLANDTLAAAHHAAQQGWITPDCLTEIEQAKAKDERQLAF
jgi:phosphatidate phosphatase APP1